MCVSPSKKMIGIIKNHNFMSQNSVNLNKTEENSVPFNKYSRDNNEIPLKKLPKRDIRAGEVFHEPLVPAGSSMDTISNLILVLAAVLINLDPIYLWICFFCSCSIYINKDIKKFTVRSMLPTVFFGFLTMKYVFFISGKQPIPTAFPLLRTFNLF